MIDENNLQDGYTEAMHAWHDALDEVQQLREAREDLQVYADSKDNENQRLRVLLKDINSQLTGDEWWFDLEVIERLRKEVTDAV